MKIKKIKVAFFSTSGHKKDQSKGETQKAAEILAGFFGLPVELYDRTLPSEREKVINCDTGDLMIVACPVFGGWMPAIPGLFENINGDATPCILMATYGNRHYDQVLAQLKELMGTVGFITVGAIAVVTPHTFSEKLGAGRPNQEDRAVMADFAMRVLEKVENWDVECPAIPGDLTVPRKPSVYKPKTWNPERCSHCGHCWKTCPAGAIHPETMEISPEKCINCIHCVKSCEAWSFDYSGTTAYLEEHFMTPRPIEVFLR